jgi:hypothetical protein
MPIDVPDATIRIVGPGGSDVLPPTPMIHVFTGFYFYDYAIPISLPVNIYTVVTSGTVLGVPASMSIYLQVVPAGVSTPVSSSQRAVELVAALDRYIGCAQHITVKRELASVNADRMLYQLTWPRWNLSNHQIRVNRQIEVTGHTLDFDTGTISFPTPLDPTDMVDATYNFRFFTQIQLIGFINDAISQINIEPPSSGYTIENFPEPHVGVMLMGAAANAIKSMLFCLAFQEPAKIFGDPEAAQRSIDNFKALKENFEGSFKEDKKTLKTKGPYPKMSAIVQPEYTMPGGRSRWFRYLFSTNVS